MNIKKPLLAVGAVTAIGLAGATGVGVASAATTPGDGTLADKIATKLNMPRGEVKAVLAEAKAQRLQERQQTVEEQLSELVKQGKLTEEQKTKLLAKQAELQAARQAEVEAMKGKTKDEARAIVKDYHDELKTWAEENGIPLKFVEIISNIPLSVHASGSSADSGSVTMEVSPPLPAN